MHINPSFLPSRLKYYTYTISGSGSGTENEKGRKRGRGGKGEGREKKEEGKRMEGRREEKGSLFPSLSEIFINKKKIEKKKKKKKKKKKMPLTSRDFFACCTEWCF